MLPDGKRSNVSHRSNGKRASAPLSACCGRVKDEALWRFPCLILIAKSTRSDTCSTCSDPRPILRRELTKSCRPAPHCLLPLAGGCVG
jgi:hypothetical protein